VTDKRDLRLVALGDSATVGIGDPATATTWRGWSRLLATELARTHRLSYTNLAVAGATARTLRTDQLPTALQRRPHLASVIVGVNDTMRSSWDPGRVRDDILGSVAALTEAGALVLTLRFHDHGSLLRLPGVIRRPLLRRIEMVNAAYDAAHAAYGGVPLDLRGEPAVSEPSFWSIDRLHPNQLGHRWLAREFALALQTEGYPLGCPPAEAYEAPARWREYWWLVSEGVPWLCRRANDLVPWALRMTAVEAIAQTRPAPARAHIADMRHAPAGHRGITVG
jgi:lysophospholipase L1-like esterase